MLAGLLVLSGCAASHSVPDPFHVVRVNQTYLNPVADSCETIEANPAYSMMIGYTICWYQDDNHNLIPYTPVTTSVQRSNPALELLAVGGPLL